MIQRRLQILFLSESKVKIYRNQVKSLTKILTTLYMVNIINNPGNKDNYDI